MFCDPPGGFSKDPHKWEHTLLRVQAIIKAEAPQPESEINKLNSKFGTFDERLRALEDRFSRVEEMLEKVLTQKADLS